MSAYTLEIVTPTRLLEAGEVSYIRCPGTDGSFGVMSGHRKAVIGLDVGEIKVTQGGKDSFYATSGGFAEITKEKVQLLVETVEKANEIGMTTIGFIGNNGGKMDSICDYIIKIPSDDTPRIQEAHILIGHILCQLIEEELF